MSKFKVGDIIKANKKSNSEYSITNQENNWTGKIMSVRKYGEILVKTLMPKEYEGREYSVEEEFFDLVDDNQIATHIVNKNAVIVKLDNGKKGVAKCSTDDKFNLAFGTALAVARAYGDKETEAKLLAEPSEPVKEEPKFKVGELVRIRQWDDMEKEFGLTMRGSISCRCCFADGMKPLCGKYAEIKDLLLDGIVHLRFFNCDDSVESWNYSTDMIEKVD